MLYGNIKVLVSHTKDTFRLASCSSLQETEIITRTYTLSCSDTLVNNSGLLKVNIKSGGSVSINLQNMEYFRINGEYMTQDEYNKLTGIGLTLPRDTDKLSFLLDTPIDISIVSESSCAHNEVKITLRD
jgi:hypothetical protein